MTENLSRRSFLKSTAAAGLSCAAELGGIARAPAAEPINFATWSAAVDTVKRSTIRTYPGHNIAKR
jgi:multiple sugar transport system substrate-binding protein